MIYQKHCPGCFQDKSGLPVCPKCGYDESAPRSPLFLPHGTLIGGQYRTGRVLGRPGGFGITYLGWDQNLQARVAIKEYLPRELALRTQASPDVVVHSEQDRAAFDFGKDQFLREARIVAQFDHPNVVRVRNFFNAHGTAYLVMDYYEGMSLGDYLSHVRATVDAEIAVPLIKPILDGLQYVHERGVVHRDLKPHNIYLATIGRAILLDFGAARQAVGDRTQSISVVLTEGYAPLEQYQRRSVQGAPTDVYGLAATLYRMVTGQILPIALDRISRDPLEESGYALLPAYLRPVMAKALAVRAEDRFQTAADFREALDACEPARSSAAPAEPMPAPGLPPAAAVTLAPTWAAPSPPSEAATEPPPPPPPPPPIPAESEARPTAPPLEFLPTVAPAAVPAPAAPSPPVEDADSGPITTRRRSAPAAEAAAALAAAAAEPPEPLREADVPPSAPDSQYWNRISGQPSSVSGLPRRMRITLAVIALVALIGLGIGVLSSTRESPGPALDDAAYSSPPPAVAPAAETATASATTDAAPAPVDDDGDGGPVLVPVMVSLPGGVLKPFRFELTEVTVAQFRQFVERAHYVNARWQNYPCEGRSGRFPDWAHPGYAQDDDFPVVCVSRADARAYAAWLSGLTGNAYRLPTEAEWEYAARGGTTGPYWWGNSFDPQAATCADCPPNRGATQPEEVRSRRANPFGVFDTAGNVREWTCSADGAAESRQRCAPVRDGGPAVLRGGSWAEPMTALRSDARSVVDPEHRDTWTGFRLVLENGVANAAPQ